MKKILQILIIIISAVSLAACIGLTLKRKSVQLANVQETTQEEVQKEPATAEETPIVEAPSEEPEEKHPINIECQECIKRKNYTTFGMNECVDIANEAWLKEIDKYMLMLKQIMPSEKYTLIADSQKKWEAYQEAAWKASQEIMYELPGSIHTNFAKGMQAGVVKRRASDLEFYYSEYKQYYDYYIKNKE